MQLAWIQFSPRRAAHHISFVFLFCLSSCPACSLKQWAMNEYQPLGYSPCHPLVAFLVFALVTLNDSGTDARYTNCNDFHSVIQGCLPLSFSSDIRWWHVESHMLTFSQWLPVWCPANDVVYINNWKSFRGKPGLIEWDAIYPTLDIDAHV